MNLPETVEVKGMRVLTTRQLAAAYGTEIKVIQIISRETKTDILLRSTIFTWIEMS